MSLTTDLFRSRLVSSRKGDSTFVDAFADVFDGLAVPASACFSANTVCASS